MRYCIRFALSLYGRDSSHGVLYISIVISDCISALEILVKLLTANTTPRQEGVCVDFIGQRFTRAPRA